MMLQSLNVQVIEAANGVAGLSIFRKHKPHLVITDIMMPEKDGIETLREMRVIDPKARIIAISGGGGGKYANPLALARELGAVAAFEKPLHRQQFVTAVSRALAVPA
jgi:YesN/AraC family two-component response regulator